MFKISRAPIDNRLLSALPNEVYFELQPYLEKVPLNLKQVLIQPGKPIQYVYFLNQGIVSLLTTMADGTQAEVGLVGYEGIVGISVFLGISTTPLRAVVQIPGEAMRMRADVFVTLVNQYKVLENLLLRYTYILMIQLAQLSACTSLHSIEQRMCCWLLMIHDRVQTDKFPLTQESLSQILSVRRASIGTIARRLRQAGLIDYERGQIIILDRAGLKTMSCECYEIATTELERLIGENLRRNE
jgi:CRP-like cAMP-binding protein